MSFSESHPTKGTPKTPALILLLQRLTRKTRESLPRLVRRLRGVSAYHSLWEMASVSLPQLMIHLNRFDLRPTQCYFPRENFWACDESLHSNYCCLRGKSLIFIVGLEPHD